MHEKYKIAKPLIFSVILTLSAVIFINGQGDTNPLPAPSPTPAGQGTGLEGNRIRESNRHLRGQQDYSNVYGLGAYANSRRHGRLWRAKVISLYRLPDSSETKILEPDKRFRREYSALLREKKTGLFKLVPDQGCENTAKVVNVSPECLNYDFPGAGASYSFRQEGYRIKRLSDLTLVGNTLIVGGVLNAGILVGLGDIPVEDVGLSTPGLGFLSGYKPAKSAEDALEAAKRFAGGVKNDGHAYGLGVYVRENNTFAMRSIAYRGKHMRTESGVPYNELDFDRRRDIIVVFRIVELEDDGTATIVWKILRDSKSPKLKSS